MVVSPGYRFRQLTVSASDMTLMSASWWACRRFYRMFRLRFLLVLILAVLSLTFNITFYWLRSARHQVKDNSLQQIKRPRSAIQCKNSDNTMHISHLWVYKNSYHAFVGSSPDSLSRDCRGRKKGVPWKANLGIGFGGSSATLNYSEVDEYLSDPSKTFDFSEINFPAGLVSELDKAHTLVIHAHPYDPPEFLSSQLHLRYIAEPTIFFCTLWENFFRTIYAGIGAWVTLISYDSFFPQRQHFVLVAPSPPNFEHLLQLASPNKITREKDLLFPSMPEIEARSWISWLQSIMAPDSGLSDNHDVTLFRAAIFGISKKTQVLEIDLEQSLDDWNIVTRTMAVRLFCGKLKNSLLSYRDVKDDQKQDNSVLFEDYFFRLSRQLSQEKSGSNTIKKLNSVPYVQGAKVQRYRSLKRLTIVVRRNTTRQILNFEDMVEAIRLQFSQLKIEVHDFGFYSFTRQIEIIEQTDILLSMHGAAMAHVVFLRPGSFIIELFPFRFRKTIYQNLARSLGIHYLFWENTYPDKTVFNVDAVLKHRFTDRSLDEIRRNPIDWYNMDSKNYWRNQDTVVTISEINHVIKNAIWFGQKDQSSRKFLLYMPWEQINNQLIGFKSACVVARLLDRVLVLPPIGLRKKERKQKQFRTSYFMPEDYEWRPFSEYLHLESLTQLANEPQGCDFITFENFISLNSGNSIDAARFHSIDDKVTGMDQLRSYINNVLNLSTKKFDMGAEFYYNSKALIQQLHGSYNQYQVVLLGTMFWYYDFGLGPGFGIQGSTRSKADYVDYMANAEYRKIVRFLAPHPRLQKVAQNVFAMLKSRGASNTQIISLHLRRGDYLQKCETEMFENVNDNRWRYTGEDWRLFQLCYPNDRDVAKYILSLFSHLKPNEATCEKILYISTNDPSARKPPEDAMKNDLTLEEASQRLSEISDTEATYEIGRLKRLLPTYVSRCIYFYQEVTSSIDELSDLDVAIGHDTLDQILIEQWIAVQSDLFVGNRWSSFSRHIAEWRHLRLIGDVNPPDSSENHLQKQIFKWFSLSSFE